MNTTSDIRQQTIAFFKKEYRKWAYVFNSPETSLEDRRQALINAKFCGWRVQREQNQLSK